MKTILHLSLMVVVTTICMLQPWILSAQFSQDWSTMINSLSGKQAISAQAASFQKFGSYPVNKATGIPDISIPIYTIKSGSLEFPINLSYHMGGIKVEEIASWVGLGWNLSAGGVINRVIRGIPDEATSYGWINRTASSGYNTYPVVKDDGVSTNRYGNYDDYKELMESYGFSDVVQYHYDLLYDIKDEASDIYQYSVGGLSGKFVYDFNKNLVQIPYSDNKIQRDASNNITITDNKGVRYVFKITDTEYGQAPSMQNHWVPVTWQLSQIISADGLDTITFKYSTSTVKYRTPTQRKSAVYGAHWTNLGVKEPLATLGLQATTIDPTTEERHLISITFKGGNIDFSTLSRDDIRPLNGQPQRLSAIIVRDANGMQIKKIVFNNEYFSTGTLNYQKRLKLSSINIHGKYSSVPETYTFSYNTNLLPAYYNAGGGDNGHLGQDYWGYYNGLNNNTTMIPAMVSRGRVTAEANRNSNESAMKACLLNKITYPTGGYTIFETEANRAIINGVGSTQVVGGLRIKAIKSYGGSGDTNPLTVFYTYENGQLIYFPDDALWKIDISFSMGSHAGIPEDAIGEPFNPGYGYPTAPGTIFLEDPISPLGYYQGSPIIYTKVTETQGDSSHMMGKTIYEYDVPLTYRRSLSGYITGMEHDASAVPVDWKNGRLKKITMYKREGSTDVKVKETEHTYVSSSVEICHGTMVMDRVVYQGFSNRTANTTNSPGDHGSYAAQYFYHYWTSEQTGTYKLSSTTEREFSSASDTAGIGTNTTYAYGNSTHYLPSRVTVTELPINSQLKQTDYTYAYNTYSAMSTKNMLNYPYEESVKDSGGNYVFRSRITYTGTTPRPYQVFKSYSSTIPTTDPDLTIMQRNSYGQVLESKDRNGTSTVSLWGYEGQYLVAEIVNATYSQVLTALGSSSLSSILTGVQPTITQISAMKALRTSLPNAHVTVYEHSPLIGVTKVTDPSGRETSYTYDSSNRLYEIREQGNLTRRFRYNMTAN